MKNRVMVMQIENFTKPLYLVVHIDNYFKNLCWRATLVDLFLYWNSLGRGQKWGTNLKENDDQFQTERKIADEIMETILRLQLPFKLDKPTEGLGNCFPIAIVQQLQRPEIYQHLRPSVQRLAKHRNGHTLLA